MRTPGGDPFAAGRRRSGRCSLAAAAVLGGLALYQLGIVRRLPDPPGEVWDAERVDASGEAYWILSAADAPLGVASFSATALLAGLGGPDRPRWLVRLWGAKLALDAGYALVLAAEQPLRYRRLCVYCLITTAFAVAAVPPARGEVRAAIS